MKNLFNSISFFALLFFVCSCSNESESVNQCQQDIVDLNTLYNSIGAEHNRGLEQVFSYFEQINTGSTTSAEIMEQVNQFTNQYFVDQGQSVQAPNIIYPSLLDTSLSTRQKFLALADFDISHNLESNIEGLKTIFYNEWGSVNLADQIESYSFSVVNNLNDCNERFIFISMASVATNTAVFWQHNVHRLNLNASINGSSFIQKATNDERLKDIAFSDIYGAGAGAAAGVKIGLAGGTVVVPGLGTAVGGAGGVIVGTIGGAIGASAGHALKEGLKWLIGW